MRMCVMREASPKAAGALGESRGKGRREASWIGCAGKRRSEKRASGLGGNPNLVCARAL